ncbi:MAG TPA: division/cell wall cluster transcriptional repressor MraZ [Stellaceae bacterium]|nr:division/cell wall cluster transcriptional repressor MraZ [Stellaceae bacterium]
MALSPKVGRDGHIARCGARSRDRFWGTAVPLFLSEHENKVDRKGRVSVPAQYRAQLAGQTFPGIVAYRSDYHPCIECCDMATMQDYVARINGMYAKDSPEHDDASEIFTAAHQLPFDGEGRIMLPQKLAEHAGIAEQACFVGRGGTFQIWSPDRLRGYQEEARERRRRNRTTIPPLIPGPGEKR